MTDILADQQLEQAAADTVPTPTPMPPCGASDKETLDHILARHRDEERELNNKIIALRKTIPKNNKAKKRDINNKISDMEYDLRQRQEDDIRRFHVKQSGGDPDLHSNADSDDGISMDVLNRLTIEEEPVAPSSSPANPDHRKKKLNKAKLKKEKRAQEMERLREQAALDAENIVDMGQIESDCIKELLIPMKLKLQEITADGHCLYNAVAAQLLQRYQEQTTHDALRKETADYMRKHPDDFLPYLYKDSGDMYTPDDFEIYCRDIETTARWGGQVEIAAMSRVKKVPIHVVQMGAPVLKINDDEFPGKTPLVLSYHKHLYSLGAHYNSLLDSK
ncbi:OTU-domain-containing protein [Hesseltinella vesiculosa]|uniref:OTU-domain-containing protein n=1 Tax=Hesseltinella vesiculosa TaxID=101127 RepID=A0A1X2GAV1_9FUNG|nr:OTU-domain-containing protein [Hesseltinella vesiculosa]